MQSDQIFWSEQTSSFQRFSEDWFLKLKASEHASLFPDDEMFDSCIDLGCGEGKLLYFFSDLVNVESGVDYSQSMVDAALINLRDKNIHIIKADIFKLLPSSNFKNWVSTQALNQYLSIDDMTKFLSLFLSNKSVRVLYFFDCIDPIRYSVRFLGLDYVELRKYKNSFKKKIIFIYQLMRHFKKIFLHGVIGLRSSQLEKIGMGYGYMPVFWHEIMRDKNVTVTIISSKYYEYRYHVIIRKSSQGQSKN
jgi:SAM-dependent methyltransferase